MLLLPALVSSSLVRGEIESAANEALTAPFSLGDLSVSWSGSLSLSDLRIGNPPGYPADEPFMAFGKAAGFLQIKELGNIELIYDGPTDGDPKKQAEMIEQWTIQGVDVICVSPNAPDVVAAAMRDALDELGALAGHVTPDDVLGRIFATFCVGK